jgi:hypothetical protein
MDDRSAILRRFFARYVATWGRAGDPRIEEAFISCVGPQDDETGRRLNAAYAAGGGLTVRSFRTDLPTNDTCWFAGDGWRLSTFDPTSDPNSDRPPFRP